jgi:3-dehydroquinate dehydratase-1
MNTDESLFGDKLGLGHNAHASGYREQRDIGPLIDIDVDTRRNINGTGTTNGEVEDVFTPEVSSSLAPAPASGSGSTRQRRRSSVSGAQKHLYNLLSFVSFLTKESLLLRPGAGERVAVEMIVETLEHPDPGSALEGHELWFGRAPRSGFGLGSGVGSSSGGKANEMTVTAISLWLIIMGEELYARAQASVQTAKSNGKSASLIDLDDGSGSENGEEGEGTWPQLSKIVIREWETWTTRLQFLSLRQDLEIQAREQAAEAAAVMRRVYH